MGWRSVVLRWLSFGRLGTSGSVIPATRVLVVGTDRSRPAVVGTDRSRVTIPATTTGG